MGRIMRTDDYKDLCTRIEEFEKKNFSKHVLTIIHESDDVKRYQFRQPDTGCYGFNLVTSDNLIQMNGDCYSLTVHPGYGRSGLGFLRGSIDSYDYFLSKVPYYNKNSLTEYNYQEAKKNLKEMAEMYEKKFDRDWLYNLDDSEWYSEFKYYELCNELNFEEPYSPRVMNGRTIMQLAGLRAFVEAYEKSEGKYV